MSENQKGQQKPKPKVPQSYHFGRGSPLPYQSVHINLSSPT